MENKLSSLFLIILSVCHASVSQDEQPMSCKNTKAEVTVPAPSFKDIMKLFENNKDLAQLIKESLAIEQQIIKESLLKLFAHDEDQDLNITQLITKYGYTPEEHEVITKDGYQLTMHRIVGDGPVVFIMHGLLCSSDDWITAGPDNSLALALASAGYDVWLGNARGNKYSKKHDSMSPKCDEFWEFCWDHINLIDVPSMIDYALNFTGRSQLSYVGYSQGTINLVALCSEMPEYNEKISIAVMLAPVIHVSHLKSPLFRLLAVDPEVIYKFTQLLGLNNVTPVNRAESLVTGLLCGSNPISKIFCSNFVGFVFGYGRGQLDIAKLPVFFSHFPAGASVRQFIHYGQIIRSGIFQKFNFTKEKNLEVYGSEEPPEYKPEKLTVPVAMFYGDHDWLANVTDVKQLMGELPNVVNTTLLENFGHADLLWGKNCKELVNEPVVELISKYQK